MMWTQLRLLTAGESHGPSMHAVLEGMPAGVPVDMTGIRTLLARRQKGYGAGGRMKIERDTVQILSGVLDGRTTGAPIALVVQNRDHQAWKGKDVDAMTVPRPGHVDLVAAQAYGYRDLRAGLERASARETVMRVAAAGLCMPLLSALGITVGGWVEQIGDVRAPLGPVESDADARARMAGALENDVACPDAAVADAMREAIKAARKARDTLGGVLVACATGVPAGLGSHVHFDRRLEARLGAAMLGIPAIKGVEVGCAFDNAGLRGTAVHDRIIADDAGRLGRQSHRSGGVEGGFSTGGPLWVRLAKKPISTTLEPLSSVDLRDGASAVTTYERSDFCAIARAVPIAEAMLALTLTDALLERLAKNTLDELKASLAQTRRDDVESLSSEGRMAHSTWQPWPAGEGA